MQLIARDNACGYQARSKAIGTDVLVGGKNIAADKFVPGVNMSFHPTPESPDGEFYLDLNHVDSPMTDRTESQVAGKVMHEGGGFKHEFYPDGDDRLKWDMLFDSPADSPDTIRFRIKASAGLSFYKQVLIAEQIAEGAEYVVPETEGSYAVYMDDNQGNQYCDGKVCTIFSPYYLDESGERSPLLDMDITPDGDNAKMLILTDTLEVTEWKNDPVRAGHKLRLDPTIGYSIEGAFVWGFTNFNEAVKFTSPAFDGVVQSLHAFVSAVTANFFSIKISIYEDDGGMPGSLLDYAVLTPTVLGGPQELSAPAINGAAISALTDYWIAFALEGNFADTAVMRDVGLPNTGRVWNNTILYPAAPQDPFNFNDQAVISERYSTWITYEETAGNGISKSDQVIPAGIKKSFNAGGSQFNKPPGIKGAFR